jgi:hypothetical protein
VRAPCRDLSEGDDGTIVVSCWQSTDEVESYFCLTHAASCEEILLWIVPELHDSPPN